jgi:DNA-binding HxlR family transcriptional regulator/cell division protein FtsB
MSQDSFNEVRAELFEALGHPMRISILESLESRPLGFAEIKRSVGIESSGHLQFHLRKLDGLIEDAANGAYALTNDGRDALRVFRTTAVKNSVQGFHRPHIPNKYLTIIIALGVLALLLSSALAISTEYNIAQTSSLNNQLNSQNNQLNSQRNQINSLQSQANSLQSQLSRYNQTILDGIFRVNACVNDT